MPRDEAVHRRILSAALELVDEKGPAGLRIADVGEIAGVSAPIIYRHFGNREGLVVEAQVERFVVTLRDDAQRFAKRVESSKNRKEMRAAVLDALSLNFRSRADARWTRVNVLGSAYARPELRGRLLDAQQGTIDVVAEALRGARDRGLIEAGLDPVEFARWQHGLLLSRVFFEAGEKMRQSSGWDTLTTKAMVYMLFGE